jgi:Ca-activated chloride channel family protein
VKRVALLMLLCATGARAQGLATRAGQVREAYRHVRVVVEGDLARTTVTQVFVSDFDQAVEATYSYPLPGDATVTSFAHFVDGRRIEAHAEERGQAERTYQRAAAEGKAAALAEGDGASRFRLTVGTLAAHGVRRTELSYTQTLEALGQERSWVYPAANGRGATFFDLDWELATRQPLERIETENQPDLTVERLPGGARIALSRGGGLERDLAVRWQESAPPLDLAVRAYRRAPGEPAYVEARFGFYHDPFADRRPPLDLVIAMDTSLSMAGDPLARSIELAQRVVGSLGPRDRVNLITFSDSVETLFPELAPLDDPSRQRLAAALAGAGAHGRSNLGAALDAAGALLRRSDHGVLLFLTDGQPTVGDPLDRPAAGRADFARVRAVVARFNYPSRQQLIESLFPHVESGYVPDGPAGAAAVAHLAALAVAPTIESLTVEWDGRVADRVGGTPSRLAMGESLRWVGRLDGRGAVHVRGLLHGQPVRLDQVVEAAPLDERGDHGLGTEWARLRIADLEAQLDAGRGDAGALREEILSLGRRYGLMSRFTSLVATDESPGEASAAVGGEGPEPELPLLAAAAIVLAAALHLRRRAALR